MASKKTVPISDYQNLMAAYLKLSDILDNPTSEITRLKAHIEMMNEEAKKLHESYKWVCDRLEALEKNKE